MRSPASSTSPQAPSKPTSPASCESSAPETASRSPCGPTRPAASDAAKAPAAVCRNLCVPETLHRSSDLLVLVEQAAEPVVPSDGVRVARPRLGEWLEGSGLAEGAVWPVAVVVRGVLGQQGCRVPLVGDEDAVEEFAADAADEAFGDGVGLRCPVVLGP